MQRSITLPDGASMFVSVDDFTDPWTEPETVVMFHGNAESGEAWRAWVPHFARRFRVVRPDMRGYGRSDPMAAEFPWTADVIDEDYAFLARELGLERFHLVGAKLGATFALRFAAKHPELVASLSVIGVPASPKKAFADILPVIVQEMKERGVRSWAATTQRARLGTRASQAQIEWWSDFMGATALSSQIGFQKMVESLDASAEVAAIRCPTLVVTTSSTPVWSVASVEEWSSRIPGAQLLVLQSDAYHIAAAEPDLVAGKVREFVDWHAERGAASPSS